MKNIFLLFLQLAQVQSSSGLPVNDSNWTVTSTTRAATTHLLQTQQPKILVIDFPSNFPTHSRRKLDLCQVVKLKFTGKLQWHLWHSYFDYEDCSELIEIITSSR